MVENVTTKSYSKDFWLKTNIREDHKILKVGTTIGVNPNGSQKEMLQQLILLDQRDSLMKSGKGDGGGGGSKQVFMKIMTYNVKG